MLIYKKGAMENLSNWRPISLSRTPYKLYVGCVANRLTEWLTSNKVFSQCQMAFLPVNGAFKHIHTLNQLNQGEAADHWVLAFADDLCLIANNPVELQASIDAVHNGLDMLGLRLNAAKCASLHLSGRRPVGVRDTQFMLCGSPLHPLVEGQMVSGRRSLDHTCGYGDGREAKAGGQENDPRHITAQLKRRLDR